MGPTRPVVYSDWLVGGQVSKMTPPHTGPLRIGTCCRSRKGQLFWKLRGSQREEIPAHLRARAYLAGTEACELNSSSAGSSIPLQEQESKDPRCVCQGPFLPGAPSFPLRLLSSTSSAPELKGREGPGLWQSTKEAVCLRL